MLKEKSLTVGTCYYFPRKIVHFILLCKKSNEFNIFQFHALNESLLPHTSFYFIFKSFITFSIYIFRLISFQSSIESAKNLIYLFSVQGIKVCRRAGKFGLTNGGVRSETAIEYTMSSYPLSTNSSNPERQLSST